MATLDIKEILRGTALFAGLPEQAIASIADNIQIVNFKLGEVILQRDAPGEGYFIVHKGKVRVVDDTGEGKPVTLVVLREGAGFGERSLFFDQPVSATVRSAGKSILLKLAKEDFARLIAADPSIGEKIEETQKRQEEYGFLKTQHLLAGLSPEQTQEMVGRVERLEFEDGATVYEEGGDPDAVYLIRDGKIKLTKPSAGNRLIGIRRTGGVVGEMALLNDDERMESAVVSDGPAVVMRLSIADFEEVAGGSEAVTEAVADYARNQLLQRETILSDADEAGTEEDSDRAPLLERGDVKSPGIIPRKFPLTVADREALGGVACLDMAARFYKRDVNTDSLAEQMLSGDRRDDMFSVGRKAESLGMMSRLVKLDETTLDALAVPAVYDDPEAGLCLIFSIGKKQLIVANPVRGLTAMARDEFLERWNGEAIILSVAPDFGAVGDSAAGLFKQFYPLLRPHWPLILRIFAIVALLQAAGLIPPFFTKILIDNVLIVGDFDMLVLLLIGMMAATLMATIAESIQEILQMHLMRRLTSTLFTRFFDHILALPITTLKKWDTGSLTARFEENDTILETTSNGALSIVMNALGVVIYLPVLVAMQPALSAIVLFFCSLIVIITLANAKKMRDFEKREFDLGAARESHIIEVVKGINTVKALAQEDEFIERGKSFFAREMNLSYEKERFDQRLEFATELLEALSNVLVLSIGAYFVLDGSLTAGSLIAFTGIAGQVTDPIEELAGFYDEYLEVTVALERVNDILGEEKEQNEGSLPCPELKGAIRFENVSFAYPGSGQNVLNNVSLEIQPGQKVAFVGRSGCGKSTMLGLVNRILNPTEGRVLIDDIDLADVDLISLRQQIGVVEQFPFIFSGTVRENVAAANPAVSYEAVVSAATLAGAHDFISGFPMRYDTRVGEGGRAMSGGQQQRLIIARALAADPKILILDEATAALDNESEKAIQKNLDKVMESRTTLAIAHRLSTIQNSDLIVVLENGEIAEKGNHDELMERKGLYHYLVTRSEAE